MTDRRQRTLARAAAQGDAQAAAALLRSRLRARELTRERVDLAAYCGDAGARLALGGVESVPFPGIVPGLWNCSFSEWIRGPGGPRVGR